MVNNTLLVVVLLTIFAASHGIPTSSEIIPLMKNETPREGRLLVVPAIGLLVKAWQVATYLISKTWFIAGLKLTALAVAVKAVIWALQHCLSMIIGASLMFGFCKLTGLCGPPPLEVVDESQYPYELLDTAESYLRKGARKFE